MKVAIVCDWLTDIGGAERVLKAIHDIYPEAPIYTSKYDKKGIDWFKDADIRTGWLQIFPTCFRRILGPLRQIYFNHLDLSNYDIIISVTGAEAKSIKKGKAIHFCYCHVPTQYYWQFYDSYIKDPGFGFLNPIIRFALKIFIGSLRRADFKASKKPDYFITISDYASKLIKKYYKRESVIIHPPVAIRDFHSNKKHVKYSDRKNFIITSRQVIWKRIDLAIEACKKTGDHLTIIGTGPEHYRLRKLADNSPLITFKPQMKKEELKKEIEKADGFIFPSLEPFGIAPVEALATGCPVIALGKGGALDYIIEEKNGVFFKKQSVNSLVDAIEIFRTKSFKTKDIITSADKFDEKIFVKKLKGFIDEKTKQQNR